PVPDHFSRKIHKNPACSILPAGFSALFEPRSAQADSPPVSLSQSKVSETRLPSLSFALSPEKKNICAPRFLCAIDFPLCLPRLPVLSTAAFCALQDLSPHSNLLI